MEVEGAGGSRGRSRAGPYLGALGVLALVAVVALSGGDDRNPTAAEPTIPPTTAPPFPTTPETTEPPSTTTTVVLESADVPEGLRGLHFVAWSRGLQEAWEMVLGENEVVFRPDLAEGAPTGGRQVWAAWTSPAGTNLAGEAGSTLLPSDGGPPLRLPFDDSTVSVAADGLVWGRIGFDRVGAYQLGDGLVEEYDVPEFSDVAGVMGGRPVVRLNASSQFGVIREDGGFDVLGAGWPYVVADAGILVVRCADGPVCGWQVVRADGSSEPVEELSGLRPERYLTTVGFDDAGRVLLLAQTDTGNALLRVDLASLVVETFEAPFLFDTTSFYADPGGRAVIIPQNRRLLVLPLDGSEEVTLDVGIAAAHVQFLASSDAAPAPGSGS